LAAQLRAQLERQIANLPGVEERPSRYGHGRSFAAGGREIAHFHGDERLDVRLTRAEIRARKRAGGLDGRLMSRGSSSDWVEIRIVGAPDVAFALSVVEEAVRANQ